MPMISCVIPVYNGKSDLPRAIKSVLAQRPDVQVVLIDDGSSDGSRELTLEMAHGDDRIVALPLPANRGQGYARNIGVAAATAPYITFLDQDDEHLPGWYNCAIDFLQGAPRFAAIRGEVEWVGAPAELSITRSDPRWSAMINSPVWNVVMRKVVYQPLGGSPSSPAFRTREGAEDVALSMALGQHFTMAKTDHPATRHYVRANGATARFLSRTRVVGAGFEFVEQTAEEQSGALQKALAEGQAQADLNIGALRLLLKPKFKGIKHVVGHIAARLLQKITRA